MAMQNNSRFTTATQLDEPVLIVAGGAADLDGGRRGRRKPHAGALGGAFFKQFFFVPSARFPYFS